MIKWQSGFSNVSKAAPFGWALANGANAAGNEKPPVLSSPNGPVPGDALI